MSNKTAYNNTMSGDLDEILEQYESVLVRGDSVQVADFLPDRRHREYREIACELIRVDLEYSFQRGAPKRLDDYRAVCPDLFRDREVLAELAFEDYRLRCQAGQPVTPRQYAERYGVPTDTWPGSTVRPTADHSLIAEPVEQADGTAARRQESSAASPGGFPELGQSFLGFRLIGQLGRGAFAVVYLARQGDLSNRPVALKVTTQLSSEPDRLARLQHTNIVPIYSVHRQGNLQAVCMPYFGATTLADVLARLRERQEAPRTGEELLTTITGAGGPTQVAPIEGREDVAAAARCAPGPRWPEATARFVRRAGYCQVMVWIVEQVCSGLAHAHRRGIVHRDLKPANVLLTDDGQPMLLDFNLATDRPAAGRRASLVGGTLPYMAPEQIESLQTGATVDQRSDVFATGVLLFELLARRHPFPLRSGAVEVVGAAMAADRRGRPPSVRAIEPRVSPGLDAIVRKCLEPDPRDRYPSAVELHEDLQRHLEHLPLRHAPDYSPRERITKWVRRHPRLASASTVVATAGLLILALVFFAVAQRRTVARWESAERVRQFEGAVGALRAPLTSPDIAAAALRAEVDQGLKLLADLHVETAEDFQRAVSLDLLDGETRQAFRHRMRELVFLLAGALRRQVECAGEGPQREALLNRALRLNALAEALDPREPPRALILQRAALVEMRGEKQRAQALRDRAATIPARTTMDQYLLALEAMAGRHYQEALPRLEAVRQASPRDYSVWLLTGNCLAGLGRLEEAEGCYTTCSALQAQSPWSYFRRGLCRLDLKRFPAAEEDFTRVIALEASASPAMVTYSLFNRALARQRQGHLQQALDDLTRAIERSGGENRFYFTRARLYARLGQRQQAEADRRQGLALQPTDEKGWLARGIVRMREDPSGALDDFRRALAINPRSTTALRNVAHVLAERLGKHEQALRVLAQLEAIRPGDATVVAGQGVLAARLGRRDAALASAKRALAISRDDKTLYQVASLYALLAADQTSGAASYGRQAIALLAHALRQQPRWATIAVKDPDLAAIRSLADFRTLTSAALQLFKAGQTPDGDALLGAIP